MTDVHSSRSFAQLDLNLLRVFATVERERSISRAAVVLCVSQSAVSHALSRLRDHLGDVLFVRQGRRVVPTTFAEALAPRVRGALGELERAVSRTDASDPRAGLKQVRIAMSEELEPVLLPQLFADLQKVVGGARLTSNRLDRANARAELGGRRFDLAIDVARPTGDDLTHERLLVDSFCVVANRRWRRLDRKAYLNAEHVVVSSRPTGPVLEDFRIAEDGARRSVQVRCQSYETACRLVASSDLLLTLPRGFAALRGLGAELRTFAPPLPMGRVEVHQYWLRQLDDDPAMQWVRLALRRLFEAGR